MVMLSLLPLVLRFRRTKPSLVRCWNRLALSLLLMAVAVFAGLLLSSPTGQSAPGSAVRQRFTGGKAFPRFSIPNLVPEVEQLNLGLHLMPIADRLFTTARAQRLAAFTVEYHRQMELDPAFHDLGSAMGGAYADLLGYSYPAGHYYLYVPRSAPPGPLPAIVFLHGSAGNFKVYTWIWSQLAEQLGCVIIAPSFGFGFWDRPGGVETVQRALADAQKIIELDPRRIHLAGLSNGGLGVSHVADSMPAQFCDCIFISPVMADAVIGSDEFHKKWAGRPILVLSGEDDERVPVEYVRARVRSLSAGGVDVRLVTYPKEDHFLFFSQRNAILQEIANWLRPRANAKG